MPGLLGPELEAGAGRRAGGVREALGIARALVEGTAQPHPQHLDTLAAALAESGAFAEAAAAERRAVGILEAGRREAEAGGELEIARSRARLLEQLLERLRLYEAAQPYRDGR